MSEKNLRLCPSFFWGKAQRQCGGYGPLWLLPPGDKGKPAHSLAALAYSSALQVSGPNKSRAASSSVEHYMIGFPVAPVFFFYSLVSVLRGSR